MLYFGYNIDDINSVQDIAKDLDKKYKDKLLILHPHSNVEMTRMFAALVYKSWGDMCEHYAYLKGLCQRKPKNQKKLLKNIKVYHKKFKKYNSNDDDTEPSVLSLNTDDI